MPCLVRWRHKALAGPPSIYLRETWQRWLTRPARPHLDASETRDLALMSTSIQAPATTLAADFAVFYAIYPIIIPMATPLSILYISYTLYSNAINAISKCWSQSARDWRVEPSTSADKRHSGSAAPEGSAPILVSGICFHVHNVEGEDCYFMR